MLNYNLKTLVFSLLIIHTCFGVSKGNLRTGFYSQTCPLAEAIVLNVVKTAVSVDRQVAARLLRLFFHDCFVQGCDGSILLENGETGERSARGNLGVGGFEVIQDAKTHLEGICPGMVSCADIVALAARDAVFLTNGPFFGVPTGRRDGRISKISFAANLPEVDDSIEILKSKFQAKGLSDEDLVLLSGGHTIGTTACFFMPRRLYNFSGRGDSDPKINPKFLPQLKTQCPLNGDVNVRLPLDWSSDSIFDDHILQNIRQGFAVIASDARLYDDRNTKQIIDSYVGSTGKGRRSFGADFAKAMVKLGNVDVKTGSQGEIRRVCNAVN
ncbi:Peroxidase 43 precursor, putative [Ricinus communis]|uniref:Peroxidase n=1 Tax=Ricinus communis TaxID=3988 RepID=B9SJK5_RICCO|nr:Peroxidase 43 precursor, putative [Ricinus communis]